MFIVNDALSYLSWGLHTEPHDAVVQVCADLVTAMRQGVSVPWHRAPGAAHFTLSLLFLARSPDGAPVHA